MAEIKSAIELAMERTKGLVMDEAERETSARREAETRVQALVRRFSEGMIDIDSFSAQFEELTIPAPLKRSLAVDLITGQLDLGADNDAAFAMLHACCGHIDPVLVAELDEIQRQYAEAMAGKTADVRARVMKRLEEMGISGSAVEPNLQEWPEWKAAADEGRELFGKRLATWTARVKAAPA